MYGFLNTNNVASGTQQEYGMICKDPCKSASYLMTLCQNVEEQSLIFITTMHVLKTSEQFTDFQGTCYKCLATGGHQ